MTHGEIDKTAPTLRESGEPLVSASLYPEKILARPQYFIQRLPWSTPEVYVRREVYERLIIAADALPPGWKLILLDCWRSPELQRELFRRMREEILTDNPDMDDAEVDKRAGVYIAFPSTEPNTVSGHCTGGAVDLTLADDKGRTLNMGSLFDETTSRSATNHYGDDTEEGRNRRILLNLMTSVGFSNYPEEWWHFDFGNRNWARRTGQPFYSYGFIRPDNRWER